MVRKEGDLGENGWEVVLGGTVAGRKAEEMPKNGDKGHKHLAPLGSNLPFPKGRS